jgi:hypothetical protein
MITPQILFFQNKGGICKVFFKMVNLSIYITEINANDITVVNNDYQGVILCHNK